MLYDLVQIKMVQLIQITMHSSSQLIGFTWMDVTSMTVFQYNSWY